MTGNDAERRNGILTAEQFCLFFFLVQKRQLHTAFFWLGKTVEQRRVRLWATGPLTSVTSGFMWFKRRTQCAFDKLRTMDFHWRQRAELAGELLGF